MNVRSEFFFKFVMASQPTVIMGKKRWREGGKLLFGRQHIAKEIERRNISNNTVDFRNDAV